MRLQKHGPWFVTFAAMLWATEAPFRKLLTLRLPSIAIVFMEHLLIAVCVLPLLLPRLAELRQLSWRDWLSILFVGFGGSALATVLFTQSFHYVSPTVAILLQKLQPLIAIALAAVVLGENFSRNYWTWALVALFGGYLVSFPELTPNGLAWSSNLGGVVLALAAALFWGGSTVFGRLVLEHASFQLMTSLRFLSGLLFLGIVNLFFGTLGEISRAPARDWMFVFIIAIVAGFVSLLIYYYGLRSSKASVATICELAFPLAAVIVNWKFLGDSLHTMQIVGGGLLLFAITRLSVVNETDATPTVAALPTAT
ncbi:MAG TPA: DMT family transporter [Vicinamibacterales bacterium]|jgi:drug/metabolite transporter (DMT)-like permease|nr:DMT family transporter [Vicinamibacterales bacterium]